jgi:hypothetical protein
LLRVQFVTNALLLKTQCSGVGVVANGQNALCTLLGMATAGFVTIGGSSSISKFNWRAASFRAFRSYHQSCGPQQQRQQRQPAVAPDVQDSFATPPFDHLPHPPSCPRLATSRQANQTGRFFRGYVISYVALWLCGYVAIYRGYMAMRLCG